jgi:prophage regulatory protein
MSNKSSLPEVGYIRLSQIIGNKKAGIPAILPIGRSTFLNGVREGKYPQPVKLSARSVGWKISDILELVEKLGA